jgi:hypothetical protein
MQTIQMRSGKSDSVWTCRKRQCLKFTLRRSRSGGYALKQILGPRTC